jgi:hypothetical protein
VQIGAWGNPPKRTGFFNGVQYQPALAARGAQEQVLKIRIASNADKSNLKIEVLRGKYSATAEHGPMKCLSPNLGSGND